VIRLLWATAALGAAFIALKLFEYSHEGRDGLVQVLNVLSSGGASILAVGYLLPLVYLGWSLFKGPPAGPNPWNAKGLEWTTDSPPPKENFREPPVVPDVPYAYDPEHPER
jgi:cytochrome c oxidase subunit 1